VRARDVWGGISASLNEQGAWENFRSALIRQTGSANCYTVSSGRVGLALILMSLKQLSGRTRVAVPAYVCPTVVQSVLKAGLEPVFCDVSPETLDLDRQALGQLIDSNLLAVVPAHLYGWAQDIRDLIALGERDRFFVIEDAAQAYGAKFCGRLVGSSGDAGYYSLGRGKCIPVGHGGIIVAQEHYAPVLDKVIETTIPKPPRFDISSLVLFLGYAVVTHPRGWWFLSRTQWNPADAGMDVDELPPIALNGLSAVKAGIGSSILGRLDQIQAGCRHNAQQLMEQLSEFDFAQIPQIAPEAEPIFLRLPIVIEDEKRAEKIFDSLSQAGIGVSRSYSRTIPDLYANEFPSYGKKYPGASQLATCLLTLPTHAYLREEDIDRIVGVFKRVDHQN
jgi:perosamine synthetase